MTLHEKLIEIKRDAEIERKQNKIILNQDIIMERLNSLFNQIEKLDKRINISSCLR